MCISVRHTTFYTEKMWSQSKKLGLPKYILTKKDGPDHKPIFKVKVEIKTYVSTEGKGSTLQIAEQNAAKLFLKSNKFSW